MTPCPMASRQDAVRAWPIIYCYTVYRTKKHYQIFREEQVKLEPGGSSERYQTRPKSIVGCPCGFAEKQRGGASSG